MVKRTFRVVFSVQPAVRVTNPITLNLGKVTLILEDIWDESIQAPVGLKIKGTVETETMDQAISGIGEMTNKISLLISYLSSTGLPRMLLNKVYDVTPDSQKGEFQSYSYDMPIHMVSQRSINSEELFKSIDATAQMSLDDFNRFLRALHWYRSGISSDDKLDRFTSFWIGLENLNPLLIRHFKVEEKAEKCSKCGRTSTTQLLGVKHLIENVMGKSVLWKQTRKTRVWIIHGVRPFSSIIPEVTRLNPKIENTLGRALDTLLNREIEERRKGMPLSSPVPAITIVKGIIEGPNLSLVDLEFEPKVVIKFGDPELVINDGEQLPLKGSNIKISSIPETAPGFKLTITKIEQGVKRYLAGGVKLSLDST